MLEPQLLSRALCATVAALAVTAGAANAAGVTRVQQSDGSVQNYDGVTLRLNGDTLWLRSNDGHGTLEITSGACSFSNLIERCLPVKTTLHQDGADRPIELLRGSVYINLTGASHALPHETRQLGPRDVLVLLHTTRGTLVSVTGTLDDVK